MWGRVGKEKIVEIAHLMGINPGKRKKIKSQKQKKSNPENPEKLEYLVT
jgi:hypothetical protein